jgi:choline dehydrogenase
MPQISVGNTMAPCVVIGERAADIILTAQGVTAAATALHGNS